MHGPADSPFPLKGKVFLCLHKIPFWDITLKRTLQYQAVAVIA